MDVNSVIETLSSAVNTINLQSIRDCYCLGRCVSGHKPSPILVKLIISGVVRNLLVRSISLLYPLWLKPDLSTEDRKADVILMKER